MLGLGVAAGVLWLGMPALVARADVSTAYVSPSGSDTAACTADAPCATIAHGVAVVADGGTVHVAAGTYRPPATIAIDRGITVEGAGARRTELMVAASAPVGLTLAGAARLAGLTVTARASTVYGTAVRVEAGNSASLTGVDLVGPDGSWATLGVGYGAGGASVTVSDSTIDGGGQVVYLYGNDTVSLTDTTITGATARAIGLVSGTVTLRHVTIGGGPYAAYAVQYVGTPSGTVTATASILAGRCDGPAITDGGGNVGDSSCGLPAPGPVSFGSLGYHGGPVPTLLPTRTSAGVDSIVPGAPGCVASNPTDATDARGVSRPQGTACDAGAVELRDPDFTTEPSDATVLAGQSASFQVATQAPDAVSYAWQASTDGGDTWSALSDGSHVSGATADTLTLTGADLSQSGYRYRVVASDVHGHTSSDAATLTVLPAPVFTQPADVAVESGGTATFAAPATGTPPLSWQWQVSIDGGDTWGNLSDGGEVSGATTDTLTLTGATFTKPAREYRAAVMSDGLGPTYSDPATLTVLIPPAIGSQPQDLTVPIGSTATFTASADGTAPLSWQWQVSTDSGATWSAISDGDGVSGAATDTLSLETVTTSRSGAEYRATVTNSYGSKATDPATLTVLPALAVVSDGDNSGPCSTADPCTISHALAAADGPTIISVAAGTYTPTGALTVDQPVIIAGAGAGITIVDGDFDITSAGTGSVSISDLTVDSDSTAITVAAGTVTLNGLELDGGPGATTGIAADGGSVTLTHSTVQGFAARGAFVRGGGIDEEGAGDVTVDESTLADNAQDLWAGGSGSVGLSYVTMTGSGFGVVNVGAATVTLAASLVQSNSYFHASCFGAVTDGGYNILADPGYNASFGADCLTTPPTTTVTDRAVSLGPIGDHGGPVPTTLPPRGSAGMDAIPAGASGCPSDSTDERGVPRPQGSRCDVGAVELAAAAVITTDPQDAAVAPGGSATFTAVGGPADSDLSWAWQASTDGGDTWSDLSDGAGLSGATTDTLTVTGVKATQSGQQYRAIVSADGSGAVDSSPAALTVGTKPIIDLPSVAFTPGTSSSFTIRTTGAPTPAVGHVGTLPAGLAWHDNGDGTATLSGDCMVPGDYSVTVQATNAIGTTTKPLDIAVDAIPTVPLPPADPSTPTAGAGLTAPSASPSGGTITAVAHGFAPGAPVTFGIYTSPTRLGEASADSAGTATLTVPLPGGLSGHHTIVAIGLGSAGTSVTAASAIAVTAPSSSGGSTPWVTTDPADASVSAGQDAAFTASARGQPSPTIRWQSCQPGGACGPHGAGWSTVPAATGTTLIVTATTTGQDGTQFRALFTNRFGTATTAAATLRVTASAARVARVKLDAVHSRGVGHRERVAVRVWDRAGHILPDVTVRLRVTGAATTSGTATTGPAGQVGNFYYTPAWPGSDTVTATVAGHTATITVRVRRGQQRPVLSAVSTSAGTVSITVRTLPPVAGRVVRLYAVVDPGPARRVHLRRLGVAWTDSRGRARAVLDLRPGHRYLLKARMAGRDYVEHLTGPVAVRVRD